MGRALPWCRSPGGGIDSSTRSGRCCTSLLAGSPTRAWRRRANASHSWTTRGSGTSGVRWPSSIRAGKKVTLSSGWKALQGLAWSGTGDEIWFTGSRTGKGGSSALHAVTLDGRERLVFSSPGTLKLHDISSDGQHVLLTRGTTRGGVVSLGPGGAKERELSWFDYSTVADLSSGWKDAVVLRVGRRGRRASRRFSFEGRTGVMRFALGEGRPLALSPDGQWALAVQDEASTQMVLLPTRTGEVRPLPRGPIAEYLDLAAWSPDSRRIYIAGRDASDVASNLRPGLDGGEPRPITPEGFVDCCSRLTDGRWPLSIDTVSTICTLWMEDRIPGLYPATWTATSCCSGAPTDGSCSSVRPEISRSACSAWTSPAATREFWKELVPPDPSVLVDIGSDPGQVRITPDGKSYAFTYWTFEGELYVAQGLK